ncbi:MAG: ABC transporter permease, partial [Anaerolineae bacterium]|nr:ABC transporter permease [Anaerolineae bacterium]
MTTTTAAAGRLEPIRTVREASQFMIVVQRFRKHRLATVSFFIMIAILLIAVFAPVIAPYGPTDIVVGSRFVKPLQYSPITGKLHILGTDQIGRD